MAARSTITLRAILAFYAPTAPRAFPELRENKIECVRVAIVGLFPGDEMHQKDHLVTIEREALAPSTESLRRDIWESVADLAPQEAGRFSCRDQLLGGQARLCRRVVDAAFQSRPKKSCDRLVA